MNKINFDIANNWEDREYLKQDIKWGESKDSKYIIYKSKGYKKSYYIRLNDFPDEPLHTLLDNKSEIIHFDDWPKFWIQPTGKYT